jgi:hypothetical protein
VVRKKASAGLTLRGCWRTARAAQSLALHRTPRLAARSSQKTPGSPWKGARVPTLGAARDHPGGHTDNSLEAEAFLNQSSRRQDESASAVKPATTIPTPTATTISTIGRSASHSGMLMRGLRHRPVPAADTWKTRSCVRRS